MSFAQTSMRRSYLLVIAALLFGGALAQDYLSCIGRCAPRVYGHGEDYDRDSCLQSCAQEYPSYPDQEDYTSCIGKCAPRVSHVDSARDNCLDTCASKYPNEGFPFN
jgi:hypothetical protein